MKTTVKFFTGLLVLSVFATSGCFMNTRENIGKLEDKKFYFTEFEYILKGATKDEAFQFYKNFPVKKIIYLMAAEYGITADISAYSEFLAKKSFKQIESDGSVRIIKNTWSSGKNEVNRITLVFEQDYMDQSKIKFSVSLFSGKTLLKVLNIESLDPASIPAHLASRLDSGEKNSGEYDLKNYGNISPVPYIIDYASTAIVQEEKDEIIKIKSMIDNYVKDMDNEQKNRFKHEMIDYIYQKCN